MVDGVNYSLANSETYQYHYEQYLRMKKAYGSDLTFQAYLSLQCAGSDYAMQRMENYVESGNPNKGDGINGNTLSNNRTVYSSTNQNGQMYQTADMEGYYEIDWDTGNMNYTTDKNVAATMLGLDTSSVDFDTIVFGAGTAQITDFVFSGLDDGQQREEYDLKGMYKNIEYAIQEFDPCYILDSSLQNMSDPEYQKALNNWEYLQATVTQWMSDADMAKLAELDPDSNEYKQALIDIILDKLDQTNSFTDHEHVENVAGLEQTGDDNLIVNPGSGTDTDTSTSSDEFEYDKLQAIKDAGIYNEYLTGYNWSGEWYEKDHNTAGERANMDALAYMEPIIDSLVSALQSQAGSSWTSEMDSWAEKVKDELLQGFFVTKDEDICDNGQIKDSSVWATTDCKRAGGSDKRAVVNVKNLTEAFFEKFDAICESGGKTQEEVAAENEEIQRLQGDLETFYNFNIKSSSLGVTGVKSEYTIPMISGNYKDEAQSKVLTPFSEKIVSTVKGKCPNLTEAQIQGIVDRAMQSTLNDDSWVTAVGNISNGGTYSIDTDKLLDSFAENIRTQIVNAGYEP